MTQITPQEYLESCKRRFGAANPDRMDVAAWEWMVREGQNPFVARETLGLAYTCNAPGNPDWCFDRMGMTTTPMPDGRLISIAGEHEDSHDLDFCIYNDVIVQIDNTVEIYRDCKRNIPSQFFRQQIFILPPLLVIRSISLVHIVVLIAERKIRHQYFD